MTVILSTLIFVMPKSQQQNDIQVAINKLQKAQKRHEKLIEQWQMAATKCNTSLKELGDYENYFEVLNKEASDIAILIERVAKERMTIQKHT